MSPLNNAKIFLEHIDKCYFFNEEIKVSVIVNTAELTTQQDLIENSIKVLDVQCQPHCLHKPEIQNLKNRFKNVQNIAKQLRILTHTRQRRGLLNIVGSVTKSLFGTLDEEDLILINQNIDKLFESNNKLKTVVSNQTALIQRILNDTRIQDIAKIEEQVMNTTDELQKTRLTVSLIMHLETAISDLHIQIDELINSIILGKQGIISSQMINPELFLQTFENITRNNMIHNTIEPVTENFQLLLDISSLTLWTRQDKIIFSISTPIVENDEWTIQKVHPIPHKQDNVFLAPLIELSYFISTHDQYITTDSEYIQKHCKKTALLYLCKRNQPTHSKIGSTNCQLELINRGNSIKLCPLVLFRIKELTFVPLETSNNYLVIPEKPIIIESLCKTHDTYLIDQPYIISSSEPCILTYTDNLMKIGGATKEASFETRLKTVEISIKPSDLEKLSKTLEHVPKISTNFNQYKQTLSQIHTQLDQINFENRTQTIKEYAMSTLQIIGYVSLGLVTLYSLYHCRFFKTCMPTKFSINICCNTASMEQTHTAAPIAPPPIPPQPNEYTAIFEDNKLIQIQPARKSVRFERPKRIQQEGNVTHP